MSTAGNQPLELRKIKAFNKAQEAVLNSSKHLVVHGAAGTGKTLMLLYKGLVAVREKKIKQVVILRSTVATRDIGFLPGKLSDKVKVYEEPYEQLVDFLYDRPQAYKSLKRLNVIDFKPTAFARGVTFNDCFVIVDEFQNMTEHELHSLMTRLGPNCTISFSGDTDQTDLSKRDSIGNFINILKLLPTHFDHIEFDVTQVVRSKIVREYLIARKEYYAKSNSSPENLSKYK
jgi:phosphate starvation-inducible protein PhoH